MIKITLILSLVGLSLAQSQLRAEGASTILRSDNENYGDGNFRYSYETSNGITAEAQGFIKNPTARSEDQIQVIQGSYSYYDPLGQLVTVSYIADENGFQPSNLPQQTALPVRAVRPIPPTARPFIPRPVNTYRPNNFPSRRF